MLITTIVVITRNHRLGARFGAPEMMTNYGLVCGSLIIPAVVVLGAISVMSAGIASVVLALLTGYFLLWRRTERLRGTRVCRME